MAGRVAGRGGFDPHPLPPIFYEGNPMTLPETEVLTFLVARVFRIDSVTFDDSQKGPQIRYRGHLLNDDSVSAYDQLAASVKPHGLIPLFRMEKGEQVIYLVDSPPAQKPANPWVNIV